MPCVELKLHPKHLYGVFGDSQWTNKYRLPDALLKDFLEHFTVLNLSNSRADSHIIGERSKSVQPLDVTIEDFKSAWGLGQSHLDFYLPNLCQSTQIFQKD
jgi:hypothetical protein